MPAGHGPLPAYAEAVLTVVEAIPAGRVLSYGDVAELVGTGGARGVGAVMARWGGAVPWWRVVRAGGAPAPAHPTEALALLRRDGTPIDRSGRRVDMARARWDPSAAADRV